MVSTSDENKDYKDPRGRKPKFRSDSETSHIRVPKRLKDLITRYVEEKDAEIAEAEARKQNADSEE